MHIHNAIWDSVHEGDFSHERASGLADFLLIYYKTPTLLFIGDVSYTIAEPSIVIFSSYTPYRYRSVSESYRDDYIHFAPENKEEFLAKLHFPLNVPVKISNDSAISPVTREICREYACSSSFVQSVQYHLMMLLMYRISEEWLMYNQENKNVAYYKELSQIRSLIRENPFNNWKIQDFADRIMLSPAYFQTLYKKAFGITCMADVIQSKISTAKEYLIATDMTVAEIAEVLGYSQVYHFIRQFRKNTGVTPGAFRKTGR